MSGKKVGILTFSYSSNPGSVLQAYALQKTLSERFDCDAHIINYHKLEAGKPIIGETVFCKPLRSWTPKNVIKWTLRILEYPFRMKTYKKFYKKYYKGYPTKRITRENLKDLNEQYDKFVVGSDQVWNFGSCNVDETYFLDFVSDNSKKISYAASLGSSTIPAEKLDVFKNLVSEFSHIAVREPSSVDIIRELTQKEAKLVLDPSLLLEKEQYLEMAVAPKQKDYVLLYLREDSAELEKVAKRFAKAKNLEFIKIHRHRKSLKNGIPGEAVSPNEWLGYMSNAKYVFTNSFHGICFSLIFEREFYVDLLKKISVKTNTRMQALLSMFGLDARLVDENLENLDKIDYSKVNAIKKEMQQFSFDYLNEAINSGE